MSDKTDMSIDNMTYATLISFTTDQYINDGDGHGNAYDMYNHPDPHEMEYHLLAKINKLIDKRNIGDGESGQKKGSAKWQHIKELPAVAIAKLLTKCFGVCCIAASGIDADSDYDLIGMYCTDGDNKGIYDTTESSLWKMAKLIDPILDDKQFKQVIHDIRAYADRKTRCLDKDLIAVNNGLFDYNTKDLLDFDPDLVFLSKSHVDYVENPTNPQITMPDGQVWDVESWMKSLSDDPEIVNLLWQILGAIIRPNVSWNKSAWLYSENGNNGKGTVCTLMRNLCGATAYAAIPLKDFSKDFMLEPLTHASAIIVDENDVGTYIDQAANLKAVITHDAISINRKFKTPIVYQFYGFMVQCMNEFPKVKDRSESFYRRQLFIPMEKRFEGIERRYIKDDYLYRKSVLEYVLWKVLYDMSYYELDVPQLCQDILEEYKEFNDPIRQFFMEVEERAAWNLLPYKFLYALYQQWFRMNQPSGTIVSQNPFIREIKQLAKESTVFYANPNDSAIRAHGRMTYPEPLIVEYNVEDWMNHQYTGPDKYKKASPDVDGNRYRGLQRYDGVPIPDSTHGDIDKDDKQINQKEGNEND